MTDPAAILEMLLRARLEVTLAARREFAAAGPPERVVDVPRLLLISRGRLRYRVEETEWEAGPGTLLFVPAWSRRRWQPLKGRRVLLQWVEFQAFPPLPAGGCAWMSEAADPALEEASMERLREGVRASGGRLLPEGELKALLARFFTRARPVGADTGGADAAPHPDAHAIQDAARRLAKTYAEPDPLRGLPRLAGMTPLRFRRQFRRFIGTSPRECLTAIRLRAARLLLHESTLSVKEVAARTGYRDPCYFSRLYRAFWRRAPSADRQG